MIYIQFEFLLENNSHLKAYSHEEIKDYHTTHSTTGIHYVNHDTLYCVSGQYTSMVVDMCVRYDTGRSVYKHGSRHVCVERYDTGRSVYKHGSRHVCEV